MGRKDTKSQEVSFSSLGNKKRRLARLLVNPECELTVEEICQKAAISRETFYKWQSDADFRRYVEWLLEGYTESELANVWKALVKNASGGNTTALKLFFELRDRFTPSASGGVVFVTGEDEIRE